VACSPKAARRATGNDRPPSVGRNDTVLACASDRLVGIVTRMFGRGATLRGKDGPAAGEDAPGACESRALCGVVGHSGDATPAEQRVVA